MICVVFLTNVHELVKMNVTNMHGGRIKTIFTAFSLFIPLCAILCACAYLYVCMRACACVFINGIWKSRNAYIIIA